MCKEDLKAALSSTNRGKNVPLICWDDALQRSKTIDLKEEDNVSKIIVDSNNSLLEARKKFYLQSTPPKPPLLAPFSGSVTWQCETQDSDPNKGSDLLVIWITPAIDTSAETEKLIAAYPPVTEWKFDVYLNDLTDKTPLQTLLDRVPDSTDPTCIKIPLSTALSRGKHIGDMTGHRLKVSANGVWPFRFYLVNTVIRLGDKAECGIDDKTPESLTFESYSTPQETSPEVNCFTPTARIEELDALIPEETDKKTKGKALPLSQISVLEMYPPSSSNGRISRTAGTSPRPPRSVIPPAQKSFQRLLQLRQKTRYETMSKIEKDQIGIRVLAGTVIRDN
ncbi:uncharacterized protein LOC134818228 [Bolinopsis microptera]|uniref:uncharacterized protein LOC134818228 n=1 Tax=Bolinopsis microptera TaxID=2820187 RepID=UPI003078F3A8